MESHTPGQYPFPDHNQNFWQLASIQASSLGIPGMFTGGQLAAKYGSGPAIIAVLLGNLVLWVVGLTIISMSSAGRENALGNIRRYLGKWGALFSAVFLFLAFISWYIVELSAANTTINHLLLETQPTLRFGAGAGALIALLSMGGIVLIRKYCTIVFPLQLIFILYFTSTQSQGFRITFLSPLSFTPIAAIIATTLAGLVNLPTFFRHSRSKGDAYLGLSLIIVFAMVFQLFSIFIQKSDFSSIHPSNVLYTWAWITFVILSLICVNLVNIYFASAGWEMIFPHRKSNKEFIIIGLLGTLAYTFLQLAPPMQFLLSTANNFITSLGVVLLLSFLIKTFEQHRPRPYEKVINFACWFFGAIVGTIYSFYNENANTLITSFCATTLAFLVVIYIERTFWAISKIVEEG